MWETPRTEGVLFVYHGLRRPLTDRTSGRQRVYTPPSHLTPNASVLANCRVRTQWVVEALTITRLIPIMSAYRVSRERVGSLVAACRLAGADGAGSTVRAERERESN